MNNSNITECKINKNTKFIGDSAFAGCSDLKELIIPKGVTNIGNSAFASCTSLKSIELPNSIRSIKRSIFSSCRNLTSIIIPRSVTYIDLDAFNHCENLKEIYYYGTYMDWQKMEIEETSTSFANGSRYFSFAKRYYYSETQPTTTGNYWHYVDGVATKWS